jgi:hypothetical protein
MARRALRFGCEKIIAARRCGRIETGAGRLGGGNGQLVKMKGGEFWRHRASSQIRCARRRGIVRHQDAGRGTSHFDVGDECVPVRDRAPSCIGVKVDSGQTERRRYQCGGRIFRRAGAPCHRAAIPASNFPGPHLLSTARTVASSTCRAIVNCERSGARLIIAPTFRSRWGHRRGAGRCPVRTNRLRCMAWADSRATPGNDTRRWRNNAHAVPQLNPLRVG